MAEEFNPILSAGIHDIKREDLRSFFTNPFENKERRNYLIDKFHSYLDEVNKVGLNFEIWIDGSFTTHKVEPNDIDIVFFYNPQEYNMLNQDGKMLLQELANIEQTKARYNCDVRFAPSNDFNVRSYWRGWFGYSRNEQVKGIARIC